MVTVGGPKESNGIMHLSGSLNQLLKRVSRSFYLTLRILPRAIRPQIGLAYLLARTTDTIADTEMVPVGRRLAGLGALRERILSGGATRLNLGELAAGQGSPAERTLLERSEEVLGTLEQVDGADRQRIRQVLTVITSGQELDLTRFSQATARQIVSLETEAELDDYTYRVAGCVGEFWTRLCLAHLWSWRGTDAGWLLAHGVRLGQGLQWVNILRDLPADLHRGRCYLPSAALRETGLAPADLLLASSEPRFRPLYESYLAKAEAHLAAGWAYANAVPYRSMRVRLACAWPVLIGTKTVEKLRTGPVLATLAPIKVHRAEVRQIIWRSIVLYPWRGAWQGLFGKKN